MAEPTVQVPVSLIERAKDALLELPPSSRNADLYGELDAMRAQSTQAAEPEPTCACGHIMDDHDLSESGECQVAVPWCSCMKARDAAEPPRIEDMVPGTTFTAEGIGVPGTDHPFEVRVATDGTPVLYCHLHHTGARPWYVDPSTIRDVTPPAGGADAG